MILQSSLTPDPFFLIVTGYTLFPITVTRTSIFGMIASWIIMGWMLGCNYIILQI